VGITDLPEAHRSWPKSVICIGAQAVIPPRSYYPNQVERVSCRFRRYVVRDETRAHNLVTGRGAIGSGILDFSTKTANPVIEFFVGNGPVSPSCRRRPALC